MPGAIADKALSSFGNSPWLSAFIDRGTSLVDNDCAAPAITLQHTFIAQLVVNRDHQISANTQLAGQIATGG